MVYAIVKAGGRQEKVSVGDIVVVDRMQAQAGDTVKLAAVLLVDGEVPTELHDKARLAASNCPEYAITITQEG